MASDKLTPIQKATSILTILSNEPYEFKVAGISSITGINRSTVHRILNELAEGGWVIQDKTTNNYKIGPMTYHVGSVYCSNSNYDNKVLDVLNDISAKCKESVGFSVRERDRVISIYEIEFYQPLKLNYQPGQFYPMNRGGYGKCLMAYYDQDRVSALLSEQKFEKLCPNTLIEPEEIMKEYEKIREQGYAISDEEVAPHLIGIGVPVFNRTGQVNYCIGAAFIKGPNYMEKTMNIIKIFQESAKEISKYMP